MITPDPRPQIQPLLISAYIAIASGVITFLAAFLLPLSGHLFMATLLLSAGFATFAVGELLNHPKQKLITRETVKNNTNPRYHRTRNPCSLGNLFDISGLLLFFISLSYFFFPYWVNFIIWWSGKKTQFGRFLSQFDFLPEPHSGQEIKKWVHLRKKIKYLIQLPRGVTRWT